MTTADERIINRLDRIAAAQGAGGAAFSDITGEPTDNAALQAALAAKVPTSRTVNGQELTDNVVVTGLMLDTAGAPDNGIGANGDYAFDDATKTIYGPKAGGVWPAGVVLGAPAAPYLVYAALLTQASSADPAAIVLQNTLGGTVVWARVTDGEYTGTLTGVFTSNKTFCFISGVGGQAGTSDDRTAVLFSAEPNTVQLRTLRGGVGLQDDILHDAGTTIEIRVYP